MGRRPPQEWTERSRRDVRLLATGGALCVLAQSTLHRLVLWLLADGALCMMQNALCALALLPAIAISGEIPTLLRTILGDEGDLSAFLIGSGVTVCSFPT